MRYNDESLILKTDSYKFGHPAMIPPGMEYMHSYLCARGGNQPATVFFGPQFILKRHFTNPVLKSDVEEAEHFCHEHGVPFSGKEKWKYIVDKLGGRPPIRIRAVPEGTLVPVHNALMTIESTDKNVPWFPGHCETLLMQSWYPITVATNQYYTRQLILDSLRKTSDNPDQEIAFKHHSFGYRGSTTHESAGIGGAAELLFSMGSDTTAGILAAMRYYYAGMCGFSIAASEHFVITAWGKEHEVDAYRHILKEFGKKDAIFACVSDSYDIYNACGALWGGELRDEVIKSGATVVIRPDSGEPVEVVSRCLHILAEKFGTKTNGKGYKVLNYVRLIQGDGINMAEIKKILDRINAEGFSTTNIAFGQGSGSLQKVDRDTFQMAIKCSSVVVNGEERDVFKSPITDKVKHSLRGRLDLVFRNGQYQTVRRGDNPHPDSVMRTIYENGELLVDDTFDTIRARAL